MCNEGTEVMHAGGGRIARGEGSIVVLTGAGISVELGLPSFRGKGGLWEGWRLEDVATPEAFARDPATVQRFYDQRRRQLLSEDIRPNAAHLALADLEAPLAGRSLDRDSEHRRPARARRHPQLDPHARRTSESPLHRLRLSPSLARGSCDQSSLPDLRRREPTSPARRLVRRNAPRRSTASTTRSRLAISSSRSAPRARSTRPQASSRRSAPAAAPTRSNSTSNRAPAGSLFAEQRHGPATRLVPRFVARAPLRARWLTLIDFKKIRMRCRPPPAFRHAVTKRA